MLRKQIEKCRRQNGKERGAKIFLEKVSILGRYQGLRYWIHMYIHMSKRIWWEDIRQKNGFITLVSANFIPVSVGAPERGRIHKHYFCHNFQVQRRHTTRPGAFGWTRGRIFTEIYAVKRLATVSERAKFTVARVLIWI